MAISQKKYPAQPAPAPKTELAHHSYLCCAWNIHRLTKPRCSIRSRWSHHRCFSGQKAWDDVFHVFFWVFCFWGSWSLKVVYVKKMKESLHWDHGKLFISSVEFYPRNQKMTQMTQKKTPFTVLSKFLGDFCLSSLKKCNVSLLGISNVPSYEGPRFHTVSWKTCPEPAKWGGNKKTGGNFWKCKANPLKKKSKRYLSLVVLKLLNK